MTKIPPGVPDKQPNDAEEEAAGLEVDLPDRPESEADVDESDALLDSGRHWSDQRLRYREAQRCPVDLEQRMKVCSYCGEKFMGQRVDSTICKSPACRTAANSAAARKRRVRERGEAA